MFQWSYHLHIAMSFYAYNQGLAADIKQSNFLNKWGTVIGFKTPKINLQQIWKHTKIFLFC